MLFGLIMNLTFSNASAAKQVTCISQVASLETNTISSRCWKIATVSAGTSNGMRNQHTIKYYTRLGSPNNAIFIPLCSNFDCIKKAGLANVSTGNKI